VIDQVIRPRLAPVLDRAAGSLQALGATPGALTGVGLGAGVSACVAVAFSEWSLALGLWLLNRLLDGLDGALARRGQSTELGGLLDFTADFVVYSGFVVAVAIARPPSRLACVVLLATYLTNNVVLLSFSSVIERLGLQLGDERSLRLTSGLAEGAETIAVYILFCLIPSASTALAWSFAGLVGLTTVQRVAQAWWILSSAQSGDQARSASRHSDA
jgi:phosphatidylglycerophosphate synthase